MVRTFLLAIVIPFVLSACASTSGGRGSGLSQEERDAIQAVAGYEFGQSTRPLLAVEDIVRQSLNTPGKSRSVADQLVLLLDEGSTLEAKRFACRQLWLVADEKHVSDLKPLLLDPQTSDIARYALERIPSGAVDNALIDVLPQVEGVTKIGIINSLGARRTESVREALEALVEDPDFEVALAAQDALDKMTGL